MSGPTAVVRKYRAFRRLLEHNRAALALLAELEDAFHRGALEGIPGLRSRYVALSNAVRLLSADLQELSGSSRYGALDEAIARVDREVAAHLEPAPRRPRCRPCVVPLAALGEDAAAYAGGKAAAVARLARMPGVPVPRAFVVTTGAFDRFLEDAGLAEAIASTLARVSVEAPSTAREVAAELQPLVSAAPVPDALVADVQRAYDALCAAAGRPLLVAMRSSGVREDTEASFAGQYATVLGVARPALAAAYREVLASRYSAAAILYRLRYGLDDADTPMGVLGMAMIDARASGVLYTADPSGGDGSAMRVSAVWGLGELLVAGEAQPDVFLLDHRTGAVLRQEIRRKDVRLVLAESGGVRLEAIPAREAQRPCLDLATLRALAALGREIEAHLGGPQDVEWCVDARGAPWIVQSRPLRRDPHPAALPPAPPDAVANPTLLRSGVTASEGVAAGRVHVVTGTAQVAELPEDTILVARAASPEHAAVIGRVRGIVTERGSATSHLACVARELGVPAIFGAEGATAVLVEGEVVTMVADGATIYRGVVAELVAAARPVHKPGLGSPLHERVRAVLDRVAPLHLVDPAQPSFSAEGCRTLHDVIRFAHEQGLREMFGLGHDPSAEGRSVELESALPISLRVIDLGGGLAPAAGRGAVTPDDVRSRPMQALWRGFTHPGVTWSGSAASGAGSFLQLVSAAAVSDSCELVRGDSYALVAADYVNLSARFGYHLAHVDAVASDVPERNHVSLQFSGGVGSAYGKGLRLLFVSAVLERLGFRTAVQGDLLEARLDGAGPAESERVLDQVARLLASTRLLDVTIGHRDRVGPMVDAFFRAEYDFLGQPRASIPGWYTVDGDWSSTEQGGRTVVVQDGARFGRGLGPGLARALRKVVGDARVQALLDDVEAYFHFPKAVRKGIAVGDAALSVRVRPVSGIIDQAGGLLFALRSMADHLVLRLNALEDNVILFEFVNGRRREVASAHRRIETGRWYTLSARVEGEWVGAFLDGEALFEVRLGRPLRGYVGLWTKADSVTEFSDLAVRAGDAEAGVAVRS